MREGLEAAQRISQALFNGEVTTLTRDELAQLAWDGLPCIEVSPEENIDTADMLETLDALLPWHVDFVAVTKKWRNTVRSIVSI